MRYFAISQFYKERFGQKVQKIPVSIATDCPNRRGLKGMQTCLFCDVWGSAAYPESRDLRLKDQLEKYRRQLGERYKATAFLAYFQSYTNTFLGVKALRFSFEMALSCDQIRGIIIGTRPDCLSPSVLDLWNEFSKQTFVSVELGVQSFFDHHLDFLKRGHTAVSSIRAIKKIKEKTSVDLGIHLMFGMPGETEREIIETARMVSDLPVNNVKLHNLHVLKNTKLEAFFHEGRFHPIDLDTYTDRVLLFLQHLRPDIAIQRLGALSSRWDELVSPEWTKYKMRTHQYILDRMSEKNIQQGQLFRSAKRTNGMYRELADSSLLSNKISSEILHEPNSASLE